MACYHASDESSSLLLRSCLFCHITRKTDYDDDGMSSFGFSLWSCSVGRFVVSLEIFILIIVWVERRLNIYNHFLMDVSVPDNVTKFLKGNLSIFIFVCKADRFIHNLLQLSVFEVVAYHHFQNLE